MHALLELFPVLTLLGKVFGAGLGDVVVTPGASVFGTFFFGLYVAFGFEGVEEGVEGAVAETKEIFTAPGEFFADFVAVHGAFGEEGEHGDGCGAFE